MKLQRHVSVMWAGVAFGMALCGLAEGTNTARLRSARLRGMPYSPYMSVEEREKACKRACMRHKDESWFQECYVECSVRTDLQAHTAKHELQDWAEETGNYGGMSDLSADGKSNCKPLESSEHIEISFADIDQDEDGFITPAEATMFGRIICIPDMTTLWLFRDADLNNDGRVSRREWRKAGEDKKYEYELDRLLDHMHKSRKTNEPYPTRVLREFHAPSFDRLDGNGDSQIDEDEIFNDFLTELKGRNPNISPKTKQHMIDMFWDNIDTVMHNLDKNGDGKISRKEYDAHHHGESMGNEMEEASPAFAEPDVTTVEPPKIPCDVKYPRGFCVAWYDREDEPTGKIYHFEKDAEAKFNDLTDGEGVAAFYSKDLHLVDRSGNLHGKEWTKLRDWCQEALEEQRLNNVWGDDDCDHWIEANPELCRAGNYKLNCAKRCDEEALAPADGSPGPAPVSAAQAALDAADKAIDDVEDDLDAAEKQLDEHRHHFHDTPGNLWGDESCNRWVEEEPSRCHFRNYQMNCRLSCAQHHDMDWWHKDNWWYKQDYWPNLVPTTTTTATTVDFKGFEESQSSFFNAGSDSENAISSEEDAEDLGFDMSGDMAPPGSDENEGPDPEELAVEAQQESEDESLNSWKEMVSQEIAQSEAADAEDGDSHVKLFTWPADEDNKQAPLLHRGRHQQHRHKHHRRHHKHGRRSSGSPPAPEPTNEV